MALSDQWWMRRFNVVNPVTGTKDDFISFLHSWLPQANIHVSSTNITNINNFKTSFKTNVLTYYFCCFLGGQMNISKRICFHCNTEWKQMMKPWKLPWNWTIIFWLTLLKQLFPLWSSITCNNKSHHTKATVSKGVLIWGFSQLLWGNVWWDYQK